jgi:hypothetical protein
MNIYRPVPSFVTRVPYEGVSHPDKQINLLQHKHFCRCFVFATLSSFSDIIFFRSLS